MRNKGRQHGQKRPTGKPKQPSGSVFSRGSTLWISVALGVVILAVYAPVGHHDFLNYDDDKYVTQNAVVGNGLTWRGVSWALTAGEASNWHPLTWLSHMLDVTLFGLNAGPHHVTNLVLHTANALLLFVVLGRITNAPARSAFVAALFALHPLHVESVAWIAERKDVLSTLLWMLTLSAYVSYVDRPRFRPYVLTVGLFALGLMAKPMLVTLPFTLLLIDFWPLGRMNGSIRSALPRLVREKVPLFVLAAASSVITVLAQRSAMRDLYSVPISARFANAAVSYLAYIGKALWPTHLAVLYPYPSSMPAWWPVAALALIGISILAIRTARQHPYIPVGWFWYVGTLVPVIGLVQVGVQSMADRYTYVPLIGLFVIVAWGMPDVLRGGPFRRAIPVAAALVIAMCAALTRAQLAPWEESVPLWRHTVSATTNNAVGHYNLGIALDAQGKTDEAMDHYLETLRIDPAHGEAQIHVGVGLAAQGKIDEATALLSETVRLRPNWVVAHYNLALVLIRQDKTNEAVAEFLEAVRIDPAFALGHNGAGIALANAGKAQEAIGHFNEALRLNPEDAEARKWVNSLRGREH